MVTADEIYDAFQAIAETSVKVEQVAKASTMSDDDRRYMQGKLCEVARFMLERAVEDDAASRGVYAAVFETIRRRSLAPSSRPGRRRR